MAAHKGPACLRPRCTQSGSSIATIPVRVAVQQDRMQYTNVGREQMEMLMIGTE
jgi:hypothetical protein